MSATDGPYGPLATLRSRTTHHESVTDCATVRRAGPKGGNVWIP
jgi:hypothetical protein